MGAIGIIEAAGIAQGILLCDGMLKAAEVRILDALPVCPGKYLIIIGGEVAGVRHSVDAAVEAGGGQLVSHTVIPNLDPQVLLAAAGAADCKALSAVGVVETFTVVSGVLAADAAVKAASVRLVELRLARGLGGKSYAVVTGAVGDVQAAVAAAAEAAGAEGALVGTSVLPAPHPELKRLLL